MILSSNTKTRHVDGGPFIDLTSLFVVILSFFSIMLRVATLQKLAQDMPTNVNNFVV